MNIYEKLKKKIIKDKKKIPNEKKFTRNPIVIEFEDYYKYSKEKKYEDLLFYMKTYPNLEACIFETFYLRLKPMVDFSDDLAGILY